MRHIAFAIIPLLLTPIPATAAKNDNICINPETGWVMQCKATPKSDKPAKGTTRS